MYEKYIYEKFGESILQYNFAKHQNLLFTVLLAIDSLLLGVFITQVLNLYDKAVIISLLLLHLLLSYGLYINSVFLIKILHEFIPLYIGGLSLFIQNKYLIGVFITFILILFAIWIYYGYCILTNRQTLTNDKEQYNQKAAFERAKIVTCFIFVFLVTRLLFS